MHGIKIAVFAVTNRSFLIEISNIVLVDRYYCGWGPWGVRGRAGVQDKIIRNVT